MNNYLFKDYNHLLDNTRFKIKVKGKTYHVYIATSNKSIGVLTRRKSFCATYFEDKDYFSRYTIKEFIDFIKTLIIEEMSFDIENTMTNKKTEKQIKKEIMKDNKLKDGNLDGINRHASSMDVLKSDLRVLDN
ncbi:hypothetical protein [Staphylococcus phage vB_SauM-HM01]|nr:hypothetical protein [Staphylococcus phage vB_SauM-HM01]WBF47989.1 hypothetical protein SSP49_164 [Staphylococcus phage SSP49]BEU75242.1 hypothetical protein RNIID_0300 [Staphylococcus phage phiRNIID]